MDKVVHTKLELKLNNNMISIKEKKNNMTAIGKMILPQELIAQQILTKLPVKSLCRFRSVSKLWKSTNDGYGPNPLFPNAHFSQSLSTAAAHGVATLLLTFSVSTKSRPIVLCSAIINQTQAQAQIQNHFLLPLPLANGGLSQSLRGLVFLHLRSLKRSASKTELQLINTATRKLVTIPSPKSTFSIPSSSSSLIKWEYLYSKEVVSFGFDPIRNQHKILNTLIMKILCSFPHGPPEMTSVILDRRVFTLRPVVIGGFSHCQWRRVMIDGDDITHLIPKSSFKSVCVNGIIYHMATYSGKDLDYRLLAFDVGSEEFYSFELPLHTPFDDGVNELYLIELNGKLGVVDFPLNRDNNNILEISVLEVDARNQQSWMRRKFQVPVSFYFRVSGTIQATGEMILCDGDGDHYIFLYNMVTNSVRKVEICGLPQGEYCFNVLCDSNDHVDSIVALPSGLLL